MDKREEKRRGEERRGEERREASSPPFSNPCAQNRCADHSSNGAIVDVAQHSIAQHIRHTPTSRSHLTLSPHPPHLIDLTSLKHPPKHQNRIEEQYTTNQLNLSYPILLLPT